MTVQQLQQIVTKLTSHLEHCRNYLSKLRDEASFLISSITTQIQNYNAVRNEYAQTKSALRIADMKRIHAAMTADKQKYDDCRKKIENMKKMIDQDMRHLKTANVKLEIAKREES